MKKKIVIVNNNLYTGGVQKALVNMLVEIKNDYDITLFLFKKEGDYVKDIPKEVNIIEGNKFLQLLGTSQEGSKRIGKIYYLIRGLLALWTKIINNKVPFFLLMSLQKKIGKFDYAISYLHSANEKSFYGGCNEFVLRKVIANKKISFIHCDFLKYGGNTAYNHQIYGEFDKIVAVSEGCKNSFLTALAKLRDKVHVVRNFNNYDEIKTMAEIDYIEYEKDYFNIVTISRLAKEKGIIRCIPIIKKLVEKGLKIRWHIIGDGELEVEIKQLISENRLDRNILLYGNKMNPYRYLKDADLFLLPSYHEAAPMVFDESRCLGIPILATATTSTKEMIEDNNIGWVCENTDEMIEEKIKYLTTNLQEVRKKKEEMKNEFPSNTKSIHQLKKILEEEIA